MGVGEGAGGEGAGGAGDAREGAVDAPVDRVVRVHIDLHAAAQHPRHGRKRVDLGEPARALRGAEARLQQRVARDARAQPRAGVAVALGPVAPLARGHVVPQVVAVAGRSAPADERPEVVDRRRGPAAAVLALSVQVEQRAAQVRVRRHVVGRHAGEALADLVPQRRRPRDDAVAAAAAAAAARRHDANGVIGQVPASGGLYIHAGMPSSNSCCSRSRHRR
jgi:hypothetical protein